MHTFCDQWHCHNLTPALTPSEPQLVTNMDIVNIFTELMSTTHEILTTLQWSSRWLLLPMFLDVWVFVPGSTELKISPSVTFSEKQNRRNIYITWLFNIDQVLSNDVIIKRRVEKSKSCGFMRFYLGSHGLILCNIAKRTVLHNWFIGFLMII